ncbi:MAG: D-glycero-alpha-D-manno-heptose-1,7-bisphosphate 7-phosphatase [Microcystaceae cyanobacterium]
MVNPTNDNAYTHHQKALFLDRDGVLIEYIPYLGRPEQVKLPLNAGIALKQWQDQGYKLIIITNQSGIGRGYFSLEDVKAIHQRVRDDYAKYGVFFTDIMICPHHPEEGCLCRKPSPYLLLKAAKHHKIDISQSFFIGDAPSDLECAIKAGCQPVLLLTGRGKTTVEKLSQYDCKIPVYEQLQDTIDLMKN